MDKPISVGDLVQVVRPSMCPAGGNEGLGHVFKVLDLIRESSPKLKKLCGYCKTEHLTGALYAVDGTQRSAWAVYRLRKLPPLSEFEGEKRDEKLTEPA